MRGPRSRAWFMAKPVMPPMPMPTAHTMRPTQIASIRTFSPARLAAARIAEMNTKVQMASQKKSRAKFVPSFVGFVEKMLRWAIGSTTPSEALNSSAYMSQAMQAPAKPPSMSATM